MHVNKLVASAAFLGVSSTVIPPSFSQEPPNKIAAAVEKLEGSTPATEDELRDALIRADICGASPRSMKHHCAIAIYRLYSENRTSEEYLTIPIFSIESAKEFRPGHEIGQATAIRQTVNPEYRTARKVISLDKNKRTAVPFSMILEDKYGIGKAGLRGSANDAHYEFVAVVGREQNEKEGLNLPEILFRTNLFTLK